MCGSDTLTTVESSTTMNVLAMTAHATIQGLTRGARQGRPPSPRVDRRHDREAGPQPRSVPASP